jgi:hypothetical protein
VADTCVVALDVGGTRMKAGLVGDDAQVITTNGALTESYVENDNRRMFANHRDYIALYGEHVAAKSDRRRFYMVTSGDALEAIRLRITDTHVAA